MTRMNNSLKKRNSKSHKNSMKTGGMLRGLSYFVPKVPSFGLRSANKKETVENPENILTSLSNTYTNIEASSNDEEKRLLFEEYMTLYEKLKELYGSEKETVDQKMQENGIGIITKISDRFYSELEIEEDGGEVDADVEKEYTLYQNKTTKRQWLTLQPEKPEKTLSAWEITPERICRAKILKNVGSERKNFTFPYDILCIPLTDEDITYETKVMSNTRLGNDSIDLPVTNDKQIILYDHSDRISSFLQKMRNFYSPWSDVRELPSINNIISPHPSFFSSQTALKQSFPEPFFGSQTANPQQKNDTDTDNNEGIAMPSNTPTTFDPEQYYFIKKENNEVWLINKNKELQVTSDMVNNTQTEEAILGDKTWTYLFIPLNNNNTKKIIRKKTFFNGRVFYIPYTNNCQIILYTEQNDDLKNFLDQLTRLVNTSEASNVTGSGNRLKKSKKNLKKTFHKKKNTQRGKNSRRRV